MYIVLEKQIRNGALMLKENTNVMYETKIVAQRDAEERTLRSGVQHYVCQLVSETNVEHNVVTTNL